MAGDPLGASDGQRGLGDQQRHKVQSTNHKPLSQTAKVSSSTHGSSSSHLVPRCTLSHLGTRSTYVHLYTNSINDVNSTSHRACCVRHKKLISIGYDINGDDYYVDIGQCRHYCHHHNTTDFVHSCAHGYSCHPSSERRETHHVLEGSKEVSVIASCSCYENNADCARQSHWLRLFDDSPLQVDVDTGVCRGSCSSSGSGESLGRKPIPSSMPGVYLLHILVGSRDTRVNETETTEVTGNETAALSTDEKQDRISHRAQWYRY
uniref:Uncharacterized protein n=1 Tax=Strigamia maritima TaxID=126957 RepID=T1INV7_STRMM